MAASKRFLQPINLANITSDPGISSRGDIYYNSASSTLRYFNGMQWKNVDSGVGTIVSETAPSNPVEGLGWFKSSTSELCFWDGSFWVEATSLLTLLFTVSQTPPVTPQEGQGWFDNVNGDFYIYDGTYWQQVVRTMIVDLQQDTSPTLGGTLDGNTYSIQNINNLSMTGNLTVTGTGNIGIGTASASSRLQIVNASATVVPLTIQGASAQTANLQEWKDVSGTAKVAITSDGNVGIGIASSLLAKIHVVASASQKAAIFDGIDSNGYNTWFKGSLAGFLMGQWTSTGGAMIQGVTANGGAFNHIVLNPNGSNVGIGNINPSATLSIANSASTTVGLIIKSAASQTANIQEWQNNSGSALAYITPSGQIVSNVPNNALSGGAQIVLQGSNGNRIDFSTAGVAAPSFNTRSVGTKLVLFPLVGATTVDYAIGIESSTFWQSIPNSASPNAFKWYAGTTNIATLAGDGSLSISGNLNVTGTSNIQGRNTASDTAPASPRVGDGWYDTNTGKQYVWYDSFWVEESSVSNAASIQVGTVTSVDSSVQATVTNSGTSQNAVLNFRIPRGTNAAPLFYATFYG